MELTSNLHKWLTADGLGINLDRVIATVNPSGTVIIKDDTNTQIAIIYGSDPEISTKEG